MLSQAEAEDRAHLQKAIILVRLGLSRTVDDAPVEGKFFGDRGLVERGGMSLERAPAQILLERGERRLTEELAEARQSLRLVQIDPLGGEASRGEVLRPVEARE